MNIINLQDIILRTEQPTDYREAEQLVREAFWNYYEPGCNEHYLLHRLRNSSAFIPELAFVAVYHNQMVGNMVSTKAVIKGDDSVNYEVLCLGPIAVLPEYQGSGIGGMLLEQTQKKARDMGYRAIFLYGDPAYYGRHGFIPAEQLQIRTADNMYAAAHQCCLLYENALDGIKGRYVEDTVYEIDETASTAFDKDFPEKERISGTLTQQRFLELVSMRKEAPKN